MGIKFIKIRRFFTDLLYKLSKIFKLFGFNPITTSPSRPNTSNPISECSNEAEMHINDSSVAVADVSIISSINTNNIVSFELMSQIEHITIY